MTKRIELRRHTDNDGDVLTDEGVRTAVEIGRSLRGPYDLFVSSGAQRATQTAGCFLAGLGRPASGGVVVDDGFRSANEDRWREIYGRTRSPRLEDFLAEDGDFVEAEGFRFAAAFNRVAEHFGEGGRALIVGHSPMQECAAWAVTGSFIRPLGKGDGVVVVVDGDHVHLERD